jgi:Mrp family chromosome partitioning ATPase
MALLNSQRMASLIDNFSVSYDFVIIDTPALNVAADARILGKMADGILLVVRPGVVDSASAAFAKELLEQSGQIVLGMVVNGVTSENKPYGYYAQEYYAQSDSTTGEMVTSLD